MQIHWFSIDLHVHLKDGTKRVMDWNKHLCKLHLSQVIATKVVDQFLSPYHFLSGSEDTHLAKSNMERRTLQGAIRVSHYNDVNTAREGGRIEASVQLFDLDKHLAC